MVMKIPSSFSPNYYLEPRSKSHLNTYIKKRERGEVLFPKPGMINRCRRAINVNDLGETKSQQTKSDRTSIQHASLPPASLEGAKNSRPEVPFLAKGSLEGGRGRRERSKNARL